MYYYIFECLKFVKYFLKKKLYLLKFIKIIFIFKVDIILIVDYTPSLPTHKLLTTIFREHVDQREETNNGLTSS